MNHSPTVVFTRRLCLALATLAAWPGNAPAHDPDTSYVRFRVSRESLETTFVYDLFTLVRIAPQLDADADRRVTASELAARSPQIADFLRRRIPFEVDGIRVDPGELQPVPFPPGVGDAIPERDYHEATSLVPFTFRRKLEQAPVDFQVRFEFFPDLGDLHTVLGVIDQDGQEHQVLFREDEPDYLYDTGYESVPAPYASPALSAPVSPESASVAPDGEPVAPRLPQADQSERSERSNTGTTAWTQWASFFQLGVEHIFLGYDHILFLLSLIVICKFKELVQIITSFTVAHTITLILATLEMIHLPGRFVESAIAATIVYVAVENFWIKDTKYRWRLTFLFGLIHGFGFAGVLRELGLPTVGLVRSLIAFNAGVEAGQLAIVLAMFPLTLALARWKYARFARCAVSGLIALCGAGWLIDRALAISLMPF